MSAMDTGISEMIDTASAGIDTTPVTTDSGVDTSSVNTTTTDNADVPVEGATDEPTETETHNSDGSQYPTPKGGGLKSKD